MNRKTPAGGFAEIREAGRVLLDRSRRGEWGGAEVVLRRAGPAAYGELADVVVIGDEVSAARAGALLGFEGMDERVRREMSDLRSPDPEDRRSAAFLLGYEGADPQQLVPYARVLTALLADPQPTVAWEAVRALVSFGDATVPLLREVRRCPLPQRRGALIALAELGWRTLPSVDRRVLSRLVLWKQRGEVPEPVFPDGEWFPVRTDDQSAVLEAFGLSDPVPMTMRAGSALARATRYHPWSGRTGHDDPDRWCAQAFVTPTLDGWTLLFGTPITEQGKSQATGT